MNAKKSIVLATTDDDIIERWKQALGDDTQIHVAKSRRILVNRLDSLKPDQFFLDLRLPDLKGLSGALSLIPRHNRCLCLAFSAIPNDEEGIQLLKSGARAYCNRYIAPSLLTQISDLVAAGEVWLGASIMERLIQRIDEPRQKSAQNPLANLTEREREIAIQVSRGANNKIIANELGISERTVKAHLTSVFSKTGAKDRLQLALMVKEVI